MNCQTEWLGLCDYASAVEKMETATSKTLADKTAVSLLGLEHPATITLGRRAGESELKSSQHVLANQDIQVVATERGGQATLHSPGQLVIYPVLHLPSYGLGARTYVEIMIQTTQAVLMDLGIETKQPHHEVGLFTSQGKLAFLGVRIKNGICRHGLSINVNNDLKLFQHIRPCGKDNSLLDKVECYDTSISTEALFKLWVKRFKDHLKPQNRQT